MLSFLSSRARWLAIGLLLAGCASATPVALFNGIMMSDLARSNRFGALYLAAGLAAVFALGSLLVTGEIVDVRNTPKQESA